MGQEESSLIQANERAAVDQAMAGNEMPTPKCKLWKLIQKTYYLPDPKQVDSVLSYVVLPPNWIVKRSDTDPYGRCVDILAPTDNGSMVKVGSYFLKTTSYDYYGSINFYAKELAELGIVEQ